LSLLNPTTAGEIVCVELPVVITSKITPDPGTGSVVCDLDKSAACEVLSVYNLTHAAASVDNFNTA
jgi:hypothetical protein